MKNICLFTAALLLTVMCGQAQVPDAQQIAEWRTLAKQGDANAQNALGAAYSMGKGIPRDYAEAVKWFSKAAEQGHAQAQARLGLVYYMGEGVPQQDYAKAAKWFLMAAEQGYGEAQYILGAMYHDGEGVPQDYVKAYMWYNLATAQGHLESKKAREQVAREMTKEQIAEAQKLSREWTAKNSKEN